MRIIAPRQVREWASRHADAGRALDQWMTLVEDGEWKNLVEMRRIFPTADEVIVRSGRKVAVFNIGGNNRLIAAVHYNRQIVYAMMFMTHAEYSKDSWKGKL